MTNPYIAYYENQAGTGIAGFQGIRYQRGHGFFGSIFRTVLKPLAKYLGKRALSTGVDKGSDYLQGEDLKTSIKKRLKATGNTIFDDAINKAVKLKQKGNGKKRKKKQTRKKKNKKRKQPKKSIKKKKKTTKKSKKKSVKKKSSTTKHLKHILS